MAYSSLLRGRMSPSIFAGLSERGLSRPRPGARSQALRGGAPPNEALQLTKREYLVGGPASRASVIESRFAAERRCSADKRRPRAFLLRIDGLRSRWPFDGVARRLLECAGARAGVAPLAAEPRLFDRLTDPKGHDGEAAEQADGADETRKVL
jgi:hypothetical protein